ncbi:MAG TPA: NAD(P)/FAD-dependent oxidoreductase [Chitinophagaceae bacterium]|nr:NAD(P)/FAD-dependent oxidoreductase [Chitinophagaceae bacterium]
MRLIIIGAGFGGLKLATALSNKPGFDILLIDRVNYHQFQPLFYQVATSGLDASNISFPLRKVFQKSRNVRIRMAEVKQVDTDQKQVITDIGDFGYDVLVIATGAGNNFFGNKNMAEYALPMKSTLEAIALRNRLLQNFEEALQAKDEKEMQKYLNIIVVGGGPTGVELSGAIADMRHYVLPKDYPEIDFSKMKIFLLEGTSRTLATMSEKSSVQSCTYLKRLGVIVKTGTLLKDYDGETATFQNGDTIGSKIVIWAAGIKGNVPAGIDPALVAKGNRIKTDRYNKIQSFKDIYAIGDVAAIEGDPAYPNGHPQLAGVAIQQGVALAKNLLIMEKKKGGLKAFVYNDKGSMATVGRNLAVVDIPKPKLHLGGFFAWMIWMTVHLFLILGVKNRFFIFLNWLYNYFTYDQNLRLIFTGTRSAQTNSEKVRRL